MITEPATSEQAAALDYLGTGSGEPWHWTEGGAVLAWTATGGTVIFHDELIAILEWLAPSGLPAFPALALLLAACRGHMVTLDEALGPPELIATNSDDANIAILALMRAQLRDRSATVLAHLKKLPTWPRGLLAEPRAKALLAEAVFETGGERKITPAQAREIVAGLRHGALTPAVLNHPTGRRIHYVDAFHALERLQRITPVKLAMRLKTGLDEPVAPAPIPDELFQPPAELVRQLLDQFQRQPDLAGLARAARDLLAALSLPRRLPESDDTAAGGVADVANRGALDKLLLSELANDDLTLATRVALNEALYLRHEPPAAARAVSVALLLDAGVRLWGVPRLFAASAALALGASDPHRPAVLAWRANGSRIEPVDLFTAAGFQNHLGALCTDAHPGAALPAFFAALAQQGGSHAKRGGTEMEAVVLTHRDTLADAGFRRAIEAQPVPPGLRLLVATVDRNGRFELSDYLARGKEPICRATIRLDEIQSAEKPPSAAAAPMPATAPLLDPRLPEGLPVILSLPKFPFLLPVRHKIGASCLGPDGRTLAVTTDRTLVSWDDAGHGAKLLASGLPAGRTLLLHPEADSGRVHILKAAWHEGHIPLSTYDPESGSLRTVQLAVRNPPPAARVEGGMILLFYPKRVDVFRLSDGVEWASVAAPAGACHIRGRYYSSGFWEMRRWYFASWDGLAAGFSPISGGTEYAVTIFDREGYSGPWSLTTGGEICQLEAGGRKFTLDEPVAPDSFVGISRDGHQLRIRSDARKTFIQIGLKPDFTQHAGFYYNQRVETMFDPFVWPPPYEVMVHFTSACVLPTGGLALRSAKGRWYEFVRRESEKIVLQICGWNGLENSQQPFVPVKMPDDCHYKLKVARWPDGRCAFLDSRGLVHLKFGPSPVEISLALTISPSALWVSDGRMAGARYFLGPDRTRTGLDELLPVLRRLCDHVR